MDFVLLTGTDKEYIYKTIILINFKTYIFFNLNVLITLDALHSNWFNLKIVLNKHQKHIQ